MLNNYHDGWYGSKYCARLALLYRIKLNNTISKLHSQS